MISRAIRFGIVGLICAGFAYLIFIGAERAGLHYLAANTLAWGASVGLGFLLNRWFTFAQRGAGAPVQFALFVAGSLGQLLLSSLGLAVLIGVLHLGSTVAFVLNTAVLAALNYIYLHFVFGKWVTPKLGPLQRRMRVGADVRRVENAEGGTGRSSHPEV